MPSVATLACPCGGNSGGDRGVRTLYACVVRSISSSYECLFGRGAVSKCAVFAQSGACRQCCRGALSAGGRHSARACGGRGTPRVVCS